MKEPESDQYYRYESNKKVTIDQVAFSRKELLQSSRRKNNFEVHYLESYSKVQLFDKICSFVKPVVFNSIPVCLIEVVHTPESYVNNQNLFFLN